MTDLQLRAPNLSDLPLIQSLETEFPASSSGDRAFWQLDEYAQILDRGSEVKLSQLVAELGGVPVGYGMTGPRQSAFAGIDEASDSRVLTHVAVLDGYRGKGAGGALVEGLVSKARRDGATLIFAHVPESLKPFYEGLGWTVAAPGAGLAWIEPPSIKIWDEARRQGVEPGPRRKSSMLRFDMPKDDPKYNCIAYLVIEPSRLELIYAFPHPGGTRNDMELAWGFLAFMCIAEPERFARLPADVSQLVLQFVRRIKGPDEADRLARFRR